MRAITVKQPWAWAIIHGGKDVENRSRNIAGSYRGPVAIHAGLTDETAVDPSVESVREAWIRWWRNTSMPGGQRGHIIGVVDLVDVHRHDPAGAVGCYCSRWAQPFETHLVFENPRPLAKPIPYRGVLGLWTLPDDVLAGAL